MGYLGRKKKISAFALRASTERKPPRQSLLNNLTFQPRALYVDTMATSLAAQLAQVAANSKSTLNVKAQKAGHSKSLIWEHRIAATQSYQTLYATCFQGFEDLCQLDARFVPFQSTLFSEESQNQDRTQLTARENDELNRQVEAFLRLVGGRLRLMPAIKAVEWLIRRFR